MKIDALVKKVELFEKLALYGKRVDFLRALAQEAIEEVHDPNVVKEHRQRLQAELKAAMSQIPADQKGSQDAIAASAYLNNDDVESLQNAINSLNKLVPWMKENPSGNRMMQALNRIKGEWKLPTVDTKPVTSPAGGTSATTPKPATDPVSVFNFVFAKLQSAYQSNNLKDMMSFLTKVKAAIQKLGGDNPYLDASAQALVDKGTSLVQQVESKLGMRS